MTLPSRFVVVIPVQQVEATPRSGGLNACAHHVATSGLNVVSAVRIAGDPEQPLDTPAYPRRTDPPRAGRPAGSRG